MRLGALRLYRCPPGLDFGPLDLQVATSFGGPSPVATELIASVLASGSALDDPGATQCLQT